VSQQWLFIFFSNLVKLHSVHENVYSFDDMSGKIILLEL